MKEQLLCWIRETDGATAVEYGLMVAGLTVAIITVVFAFGEEVGQMFQYLDDQFSNRPS